MHGDFSRLTFDPTNRFSAVLLLQGRVHVEADSNEQVAILQHYVRTLAADLLGEFSFPKADPGFAIKKVVKGNKLTDLEIGYGRCYLDGLLVENPRPSDPDAVPTTFYQQPDAYFDPEEDPLPSEQPFFVYLQAWERLVTWVEDPAIRDVALGAGGPDASARVKVVWQVRLAEAEIDGAAPTTTKAAMTAWEKSVKPALTAPSTGALSARVVPTDDDELGVLAPEAGYRGLENQLYRVEIHAGGELEEQKNGGSGPTFKWSRDNGSVVFPIEARQGKMVTLATLGRDDRSQLDIGDWVEIVDDARALAGPPADLHRVEDVDLGDRRVALDAAPTTTTGADPGLHPFLRRWDQQERSDLTLGSDHAITVVLGSSGAAKPLDASGIWMALEDGVEVLFEAGTYRSGDYWLIPARVETQTIEWPRKDDLALAVPPHGYDYHSVPLAFFADADKNPVKLPSA